MIKIALTGSIGMGKSTVAAMFAEAGIPVFDADAEVRLMQGYGGSLVDPIDRRFAGTKLDGAIDRDLLAARVLADRDELAALEFIVHPAVAEARERFIEDNRGAPALPAARCGTTQPARAPTTASRVISPNATTPSVPKPSLNP